MSDKGEIICSMALAGISFYIFQIFLLSNKGNQLNMIRFKRIVRIVKSEIGFKSYVIDNDVHDYISSNEINIRNPSDYRSVISFKIKYLRESIKEVCGFFDVNFEEFVEFFNKNVTMKSIVDEDYCNRDPSPRYDWGEKFTVQDYRELLRKYKEILKSYKRSGNYFEFIHEEALLFDEYWRRFRMSESRLKGAHYRFHQHIEVKKLLKKIELLKKSVIFKPLDLPD